MLDLLSFNFVDRHCVKDSIVGDIFGQKVENFSRIFLWWKCKGQTTASYRDRVEISLKVFKPKVMTICQLSFLKNEQNYNTFDTFFVSDIIILKLEK